MLEGGRNAGHVTFLSIAPSPGPDRGSLLRYLRSLHLRWRGERVHGAAVERIISTTEVPFMLPAITRINVSTGRALLRISLPETYTCAEGVVGGEVGRDC